MLVEKSTPEEIKAFVRKASDKYIEIEKGWLKEEIRKLLLRNRRTQHHTLLNKSFLLENQRVYFTIYPLIEATLGSVNKKEYYVDMYTYIETRNGKLRCMFYPNCDEIGMASPHYMKRFNERKPNTGMDLHVDVISYIRNDREYEIRYNTDCARITRIKDGIVYYITFLSPDMCVGKHHQELLRRIKARDNKELGQIVDKYDIYEWK